MLSDWEIEEARQTGLIEISPWDPHLLQPVSYDLTLSHEIRIPLEDIHTVDPLMANDGQAFYGRVPADASTTELCKIDVYTLEPRDFILGATMEYLKLSDGMAARVEGKSSLGRLGVAVHITAGFIDPGFEGQITLEIVNLSRWGLVLYPNMPIAQIVFEPVTQPSRSYRQTGHYQGQTGPTESRYRFRP